MTNQREIEVTYAFLNRHAWKHGRRLLVPTNEPIQFSGGGHFKVLRSPPKRPMALSESDQAELDRFSREMADYEADPDKHRSRTPAADLKTLNRYRERQLAASHDQQHLDQGRLFCRQPGLYRLRFEIEGGWSREEELVAVDPALFDCPELGGPYKERKTAFFTARNVINANGCTAAL
ncbi:MAG: hypothetical protein KC731_36815, partial [Myxococcales bacterium]|nr:hypothetical protein [Myxococcales bacterium]